MIPCGKISMIEANIPIFMLETYRTIPIIKAFTRIKSNGINPNITPNNIASKILIGIVLYISSMKIGMLSSIMLILPHGIIEIPALILGCSYGLWLGKMLILKIIGKEVPMMDCIKYSIIQYVKFIIPMLIIAALVETYLTPFISTFFMKIL